MAKKKKRHSVKIRWGTQELPEPPPIACTYSFPTKAELNAFLTGVDEASGWMEYEVVE